MIKYQSTKTYTHSAGLSCCFRQWRATHSHCQFLHGYAIQVKLVFESAALDERNWVVDFGGLKDVKAYLEGMFDHKTIVAEDDPLLPEFQKLRDQKGIQLVVVPDVGCEKFALMIFQAVDFMIAGKYKHARLKSVEVSEHEGNSAVVLREEDE